jgi:DNA segregation ATPase FtsK/SpoIIIE-like protein
MQNKIYTKQIKQKDYIKEYLYVLVLAALFCAAVSIITYDPNDPSTFQRSENYSLKPSNYFGFVGASFSDWSFQLFGLGVIVFLIVFILQILHIFRYKISKTNFYLKLFGYPQLVLFYLGFLSGIKPLTNYKGIQILTGGVIGNYIFDICRHIFGTFGALTILLLGAISSLTLCLGITPLSSVLWILKLIKFKPVKNFAQHVSSDVFSHSHDASHVNDEIEETYLTSEIYRINQNVFLDLVSSLTSDSSKSLKDIWQSKEFQTIKHLLPIAYGMSTDGVPIVFDISVLPNLLIQAESQNQKNQTVNILILSLMLQKSPSELKMILIDPQLVDFSNYVDIGHLYMPVITSSQRCTVMFEWILNEVEKRLILFKQFKVRNFTALKNHLSLPYFVIVINEIYDLFASIPFEFKLNLQKFRDKAQMAGIYLICATHYPATMFGDSMQEIFPNKLVICENRLSIFCEDSEDHVISTPAQLSEEEMRVITNKLRALYPFAIDNIKVK